MRHTVSWRLLLAVVLAGCGHQPAAPPQPIAVQRPVIVQLVGRDKIIIVTKGPKAPLYWVKSMSGEVLVADATLEEMKTRYPGIYQQIESAIAPCSTRIDAESSGLSVHTACKGK